MNSLKINDLKTVALAGLVLGCGMMAGTARAQAPAPSPAAPASAPAATAPAAAHPAPPAAPATAPTAPVPAAAPSSSFTAPVGAPPLRGSAEASPTDSGISLKSTGEPQDSILDQKQQRDFFQRYKKCLGMETRMERLSCYDDIAQQMSILASDQKAKEDQVLGTYGFWRVIFTRDELGRDKTFLRLESSNQVHSDTGVSTRPNLVVSCQAEKTDVYLDWKYLLNTNPMRKYLPVAFSIDGFPAVQQNWMLSNDNFAVYSPDPPRMIRALKGHLKMILTMTAETEGTSSLTFDLPGFENVIKILIRRCYPRGINPTQGINGAGDAAHPAQSEETAPPVPK